MAELIPGIPHNESKVLSSRDPGYESWKEQLPPDMDRSGKDYDLYGAYKAGLAPAPDGHLPDTYKLPNHPTFSDESVHSKPGQRGGHWSRPASGITQGDVNQERGWTFTASQDQMGSMPAGQREEYFKNKEPGNILVQPLPDISGGVR